ncbi:DUF6961 family protein [Novosphingobium marinum]|uniref:Uncharacterized protein n=1 Tax=Novosphingobium marinum TaxID=1514948 RepID=A0A7Y9Y150_9SPHN|nr:hypothetical protein [Novosphingobium marinum]NYH97058.1 hypothetical protein [Novosphingobium marinum]
MTGTGCPHQSLIAVESFDVLRCGRCHHGFCEGNGGNPKHGSPHYGEVLEVNAPSSRGAVQWSIYAERFRRNLTISHYEKLWAVAIWFEKDYIAVEIDRSLEEGDCYGVAIWNLVGEPYRSLGKKGSRSDLMTVTTGSPVQGR